MAWSYLSVASLLPLGLPFRLGEIPNRNHSIIYLSGIQDRTNGLIHVVRGATESFRVQRDLRKIVLCAGHMGIRRIDCRYTWVQDDSPRYVQNYPAVLQLISEIPHLTRARVGSHEWRRGGMRDNVSDSPEEWRDRSWWN